MDKHENVIAEHTLDKSEDNIIQVNQEACQLYFRPDTEEIVIIPEEDAGDFEAHWMELLSDMDEFHNESANYSNAIEKYGVQKMEPGLSSAELQALEDEVTQSEKLLEERREKLLEKLHDNESKNMGYHDMVELLPLAGSKNNGRGKSKVGKRYVYVQQKYYSNVSEGHKKDNKSKKGKRRRQNNKNSKKPQSPWRTVSLKNKDVETGKGSIFVTDKKGKTSIDTKKLKEQLTKEMRPKFAVELKDYVDLDNYNFDKTLFDWADSWNEAAAYGETTLDCGIDLSGSAQFMRYVSNLGASAEFNSNTGEVKVKAEARRAISIASGIASATFYIPDSIGWNLNYKYVPKGRQESDALSIDLGVIRLCLEQQLIGFIGASVQLEGQLQVALIDDEKQVVMGQKGADKTSFAKRQKGKGRTFQRELKESEQGLSVAGDAFGGAKIDYTCQGTFQWLKPTPPHSGDNEDTTKTVGEFVDLAKLGFTVAALAGLGGGGNFFCSYIEGKFCFRVSASVCSGIGAKGGFLFEVGADKFLEFSLWVTNQLFAFSYRFLDLIAEEAFDVFTQMCVMQLMDFTKKIYDDFQAVGTSITQFQEDFELFYKELLEDIEANKAASQRRNQLAENILAEPERLLSCTPEAKAILIYLLTRHGLQDHIDVDNRGCLGLDIYAARKEAIIQVLYSIQSQREWLKVMCRVNANGTNMAKNETETVVAQRQVAALRDFLQEGFNRDDEMDRVKAKLLLQAIYASLKDESELSFGYALAMNNTPYYRLNRSRNPYFPQCSVFERFTTDTPIIMS